MEDAQGKPEEISHQGAAQHLGLSFYDEHLLARALTHRSYLNEHPEALQDNERLEFLGDAVLDFLVGAWLYNRFPEMAEGALTRLRAALVGNDQLAEFARQIELGKVMRLGRGEVEGGGRDRSPLLGSTFEALVGALFLDQGIPAVQRFAEPLLEAATSQILAEQSDYDPKSLLQEWVQSQGYGPPHYRTASVSGPDHERTFEVEVLVNNQVCGAGKAPSKRLAAKDAARSAIESLGIGIKY